MAPPGGVSQISFGDYNVAPTGPPPPQQQVYSQPDYQQQQYDSGAAPAGRGATPRGGQIQFGGPGAPSNTYQTASGAYGNAPQPTAAEAMQGSPNGQGSANNNYSRPNGMQNVRATACWGWGDGWASAAPQPMWAAWFKLEQTGQSRWGQMPVHSVVQTCGLAYVLQLAELQLERTSVS